MSKVDVKNPSLTRGETLEDQKVGSSTATTVSKLLATSAKWATVAVNFAMVETRIEMLRSAIGGLRNGTYQQRGLHPLLVREADGTSA